MKKHAFQFIFAIILLVASFEEASAQKFGHLNYGNFLDQMPEVSIARKELDSLKTQMVTKGEELAKAFEAKYIKMQEDYSAGLLTPVQTQKAQEELQKEDEALQKYEKEVQSTLEQRRIVLLKPIVEKVELAIQAVAKENGYTFVFDSSLPNVMLFAEDQDDIAELVKKKLGMQ